MGEFKFYNQLDPGPKDKKKSKYESRDMVLNQAQDQTEKQQKKFRVAINLDLAKNLEWLWLPGRYASHSELTRKKLKDRVSKKNQTPYFK